MVEDIRVTNIVMSYISICMSPDAKAGHPDMADDMELMQRAGFFVRNARRLGLHNPYAVRRFACHPCEPSSPSV